MEQETQKSNPAPESPDTPVASNTKVTQQTDAEPPCSTTQRAIWDDAQQLATLRDRDTAFVVVTHDPRIAARMDRQLTLTEGRLEAS